MYLGNLANFPDVRIVAVFTERFMMSVKYLSAIGLILCKWIGATLLGPTVLVSFLSLIASFTVLQLNDLSLISSFLNFY